MSEKFAFENIRNWTFTIFCLVLFSGQLYSQSQNNSPLYLWNGFSHHWGYNHRVNRLGDYLEFSGSKEDPEVAVVHTAASGSGADVAEFSSFYTEVKAPHIFQTTGVEKIHLEGRKGDLLEVGRWVTTDLSTLTAPNCEVLLNGFDLYPSEGYKPDKFIEFQLRIDSVSYSAPVLNGPSSQPGQVSFYIRVAFNFACTTPECPRMKRISSYELEVHWGAIEGDFFSQQHHIKRLTKWTKDSLPRNPILKGRIPKEIESSSMNRKIADPDSYHPSLGISGFGLQLEDKDLHFADFNFNVRIEENEGSGVTKSLLSSYFGQWTPGMYDAYRKHYAGWPKLPAKWVVKKAAGQGVLRIDYLWLGFKDAEIEQGSVSGQVEWLTRHGKQESSGGEKALTRIPVQ